MATASDPEKAKLLVKKDKLDQLLQVRAVGCGRLCPASHPRKLLSVPQIINNVPQITTTLNPGLHQPACRPGVSGGYGGVYGGRPKLQRRPHEGAFSIMDIDISITVC